MEKQLKCVLLLSLKEISLRRLAVLLWNGSDILACISNVSQYMSCEDEEREYGDKIQDKMLKLELPKSLTNQMIELVGPMSLEVRRWIHSKDCLIRSSNNAISVPGSEKLCWTTAGTINYRKTAEELVRCVKLDVEQRYKIACYYCLDDRISLYWEELSEEKKVFYGNGKNPLAHLTYCWPYILKGQHSELDHLAYNRYRTSFNQFAFENLAKRSNETATEYFFQKLSHEEREATLMTTAHAVMADFDINRLEDYSNVWFYLLSLMTPEQQMEIIKAHPIKIFLCFLRSQLQGLFQENVGLLWALLPPSSYIALLQRILKGYPIIYTPKMIKEFLKASPQDFKTCLVHETSVFPNTPAYQFLLGFFRCNDSESIKVLFRNVDAAFRANIVRRNLWLFSDFGWKGRWPLSELCLREATLSKEEKGGLKDDLMGLLEIGGESQIPRFKRFLEFLNETDASSGKRKKARSVKLENGSS